VHKAAPIQAEKTLLGVCHWQIQVKVPQARIAEEFDHAFISAAAHLKLPGFRPGKIPAQVARQMLGASALEHAREHLFEHVVSDSLRSVGLHNEVLRLVDFDASKIEVSELRDLELSFQVQTMPEVNLPAWSEIQVERQDTRASAEQIEQGVQALANNHQRFDAAAGATVDEEHVAEADLVYSLDGADGPSAQGLKIGLGSPLYGTEAQAWDAALRGRKAGEQFSIEVDFHPGFSHEAWVGKRGSARVSVLNVVKARPATAAEVVADLELKDEADLREKLGVQIGRENARRERERMAHAILEKIVELRPVELSERMIDEETEATIQRRVEQMKQAGATEEQAKQAADEHRDEVRTGSARRLKHWFVVRKVAQQEKVRVSENELEGALRALAMRQNVDPVQLKAWFKEEGRLDQLRADILEEKVRNHLVQLVEKKPEPAPLR
jgi:trigger factor